MATISFNIKDTIITELEEALCHQGGYQEFLENGTPNPDTKSQFARKQVKKLARNALVEYRNMKALQQVSAVDNDI